MNYTEENKSLLISKNSKSEENLENHEGHTLRVNKSESMDSKTKQFIFPEIPSKTTKEFSFGEEMINQGIETIEFVLSNASNHLTLRLCFKHSILFETLGSVVST